MLEEKMLEKKIWAVVGANQDPEKYGNMIYRKLKTRGYDVYAVNPMYETVEGDKCFCMAWLWMLDVTIYFTCEE